MVFPKRKKYPKTISVGGEEYHIVFRDKIPKETKDTLGLCDPNTKTIYIKTGQSNTQTFRTLIHELLHAMEEEYNITLKHEAVYQLEEAIADLMLLNF